MSIRPAPILILIMLLLVAIPYWLAWLLVPAGMEFAGFLVNPLDGFSYLAKMNQGQAGQWLFSLPYAPNPGEPALLFIFYIVLGKLAGWLSAAPIMVFHVSRLVMAAAMAWAAHYLFWKISGKAAVARWSLVVFLFASGLGWLAAPFGWLTSDLLIPESIPFFAASLNPHFPLTYAALALAAALVLSPERLRYNLVVNIIVGTVLGAVQPFAAISLTAVLLLWVTWELAISSSGFAGWRDHSSLPAIGALVLGAAPWLLYDFWLTRTHPVLQAWNLQNQTPSPSPPAYLLGFGIPLLLALYGLVNWRPERPQLKRFIVTWLVVNALLLYAPLDLQRRFSLGLFLPIAAAAGVGIQKVTANFQRRQWLPYLLIFLAVPSNLLAMAAGVGLVADGSPLLLMTEGERAGYHWIAENLEGEPLILAAPRSGNRLPAYGQVRVLYGHPFETPNAEASRERVIKLLESFVSEPSPPLAGLNELQVDYLVVGPHERQLLGGREPDPDWPILFSEGDFMLYSVPTSNQ